MSQQTAMIFDIGRFRSTDGPGIRTIIFFKGCPLRCQWCSNPFGLSPQRQLVVNPVKCTGCGACVDLCPKKVNQVREGKVTVAFDQCGLCGLCAAACPGGARTVSGQAYSPQELCREAQKDAAFYRKGGGGVTLSGGEVLLQYKVAAETLRLCRKNYLNTCIETSAFAPWEHLWEVAQYCHTVFVDLKHMDSQRHRALTGVPNELILENIRRLCQELPAKRGRVIVRLPVIPGYNDDEENITAGAAFVAALPGTPELNLLPYHNLGESKYEMMGEEYALAGVDGLGKKDRRMTEILALCRERAPHTRISVGGEAIDLSAPIT